MDRYINIFSTSGDVQTAVDNGLLGKPYVAYVESDGAIDWNTKEEIIDYSKIPLTFKIHTDGYVKWGKINGGDEGITIQYNKNNTGWSSITSTNESMIDVVSGDTIQFKGDSNAYGVAGKTGNFAYSTAGFIAEGNIMSMINSTNYSGLTSFETQYTFRKLFNSCSNLTSVENLILPVTSLTAYCYDSMFTSTNITYLRCLASSFDKNAKNCCNLFLYQTPENGVFVKKRGVNWNSQWDGTPIPSTWTVIEE